MRKVSLCPLLLAPAEAKLRFKLVQGVGALDGKNKQLLPFPLFSLLSGSNQSL